MIELNKYDMNKMIETVYHQNLGDDEQIFIFDKRCMIMGANVAVPIKAWSNPPRTIVQFDDNTKVVVKCEDGKPYDFFAGFCIALEKKRFGSSTALNEVFKACQEEANRRKYEREVKQAFAKYLKESSRQYAKEYRESKIRKRMEELRIEREAQYRIEKNQLDKLRNEMDSLDETFLKKEENNG